MIIHSSGNSLPANLGDDVVHLHRSAGGVLQLDLRERRIS